MQNCYKVRVLKPHRTACFFKGELVRADVKPGQDIFIPEISMVDVDRRMYAPYRHQLLKEDGKVVKERKRPVIKPEPQVGTELPETPQEAPSVATEVRETISNLETAAHAALALVQKLKGDTPEPPKTETIQEVAVEPIIEDASKAIELKTNKGEIVPQELMIDEGDEPEKKATPYTESEYRNRKRMTNRILQNSLDLSPDQRLIHLDTTEGHLPKFAEINNQDGLILGCEEGAGELLVENQIVAPGQEDIFDSSPLVIPELVKDENGRVDVLQTLGWIVNKGA